MCPRSSSRGHSTSASVTVTVTVTEWEPRMKVLCRVEFRGNSFEYVGCDRNFLGLLLSRFALIDSAVKTSHIWCDDDSGIGTGGDDADDSSSIDNDHYDLSCCVNVIKAVCIDCV